MARIIASALLGFVVTAAVAGSAVAGTIVFQPATPGQTAGWKPANQSPATGTGGGGYWDQRSYDSYGNSPGGACNAGTLVNSTPCDWAGGVNPPNALPAVNVADPTQLLQYFGLTDGTAYDAPLDFYFEAGFEFDWKVLYQLTDWSEDVEFGWYEVGNLDNKNPIVAPKGAFAPPEAATNYVGNAAVPNVPFGFYYRNTRYTLSGEQPPLDGLAMPPFTFYTQSSLNTLGSYTGYFRFDTASGLNGANQFEDEQDLLVAYNPASQQQFALFRQGNSYWLGLEDQIGRLSPSFCWSRPNAPVSELMQPCSDYDFNDFIIGFTERTTSVSDPSTNVPEPAVLALLGGGLFALAWAHRRRASRRGRRTAA